MTSSSRTRTEDSSLRSDTRGVRRIVEPTPPASRYWLRLTARTCITTHFNDHGVSLPSRVVTQLAAMTDHLLSRALQLATLDGCSLAIGRYPPFTYNGLGGGGPADLSPAASDGLQHVRFEPARLYIPPLDRRSARFLGLPLPPGLAVTITPVALAGQLDRAAGAMCLCFRARFQLQVGPSYRAPDLWIETQLSTGSVTGQRHRASGQPLSADGVGVMVGVAAVAPTGEVWLDRFLGLPDEALAVLRFRLQ